MERWQEVLSIGVTSIVRVNVEPLAPFPAWTEAKSVQLSTRIYNRLLLCAASGATFPSSNG
jgi:hypothetical protein